VSAEQRAHYKKEFNTHYNKYILLHKVLDGVRARFTSLEARLRAAPKGSPEFEVRNIHRYLMSRLSLKFFYL
jgi:hypothetical protein